MMIRTIRTIPIILRIMLQQMQLPSLLKDTWHKPRISNQKQSLHSIPHKLKRTWLITTKIKLWPWKLLLKKHVISAKWNYRKHRELLTPMNYQICRPKRLQAETQPLKLQTPLVQLTSPLSPLMTNNSQLQLQLSMIKRKICLHWRTPALKHSNQLASILKLPSSKLHSREQSMHAQVSTPHIQRSLLQRPPSTHTHQL